MAEVRSLQELVDEWKQRHTELMGRGLDLGTRVEAWRRCRKAMEACRAAADAPDAQSDPELLAVVLTLVRLQQDKDQKWKEYNELRMTDKEARTEAWRRWNRAHNALCDAQERLLRPPKPRSSRAQSLPCNLIADHAAQPTREPEIPPLTQQLEAANARAAAAEARAAAAEARAATAEAQAAVLAQQLAPPDTRALSLRRALGSTVQAMLESRDVAVAAKARAATAEARAVAAEARAAALAQELEAVNAEHEAEVARLEQELQAARAPLMPLRRALGSTAHAMVEWRDKAATAKARATALGLQLEAANAEHEDEVYHLSERLGAAEAGVERLEQERKATFAEVIAARRALGSTAHAMFEWIDQAVTAKERAATAKARAMALAQQLEAATAEREALTHGLDELAERLEQQMKGTKARLEDGAEDKIGALEERVHAVPQDNLTTTHAIRAAVKRLQQKEATLEAQLLLLEAQLAAVTQERDALENGSQWARCWPFVFGGRRSKP